MMVVLMLMLMVFMLMLMVVMLISTVLIHCRHHYRQLLNLDRIAVTSKADITITTMATAGNIQ